MNKNKYVDCDIKEHVETLKLYLPPFLDTSPRQLFGTLGAHRLWQLNLQSVTVWGGKRRWENQGNVRERDLARWDERVLCYWLTGWDLAHCQSTLKLFLSASWQHSLLPDTHYTFTYIKAVYCSYTVAFISIVYFTLNLNL